MCLLETLPWPRREMSRLDTDVVPREADRHLRLSTAAWHHPRAAPGSPAQEGGRTTLLPQRCCVCVCGCFNISELKSTDEIFMGIGRSEQANGFLMGISILSEPVLIQYLESSSSLFVTLVSDSLAETLRPFTALQDGRGQVGQGQRETTRRQHSGWRCESVMGTPRGEVPCGHPGKLGNAGTVG